MAKRPAARRLPKPSKPPDVTRRILSKLGTQHPNADTELHFSNPYELLVATILSAQCTDERVNQVTPALFRRYPDARALARATTAELEPQIQSTGFFRAKSRALTGMATAVVDRFAGDVPKTMDELTTLPGVGRKTANVVLGHALGVPGLPVDRHVLRVANRIGIAKSDDPAIVETQLTAALPPADWTRASDTLILHGRRICKPKPLCDRCAVREDCDYFRKLARVPVKRGQRSRSGANPRGIGGGSGSLLDKRRAATPRGTSRGSDSRQSRAESRSLLDERRAANPLGTARGSDPRQSRAESGSLFDKRRAATPRGTGRGGGAPRRIK